MQLFNVIVHLHWIWHCPMFPLDTCFPLMTFYAFLTYHLKKRKVTFWNVKKYAFPNTAANQRRSGRSQASSWGRQPIRGGVGGARLVVEGTEQGDSSLDPVTLGLGGGNFQRKHEVGGMSGGRQRACTSQHNNLPLLQILHTAASLYFSSTDSTHCPDCLPTLLSISVFYFLVFLFSTF